MAVIAPTRFDVTSLRCLFSPLMYMSLIWVLSSIPGGSVHVSGAEWLTDPTIQNFLHIPLFGGLAYVWLKSLLKLQTSTPLLLAAAIAVAYGIIDEWHQSFVPGRYASAVDVALDSVGIALALGWKQWRLLSL
jgi:hypothetical protein